MLQKADSVGVFQVESRAQMATLPRLKPREFYDLVVEVALIRPGPIQGGSVHPYIRRRNGLEEPTYDHPLLAGALKKTLGVPLFQEQLMQIAVDVAGFSAGDADELRRAMGSKRSTEKMERLRGRFFDGMAANDITGEVAQKIFDKMLAFANFGFPESHSISFASLVYYSAWFKLYHPAAFCAALLNSQPMGFYSPQSLVADARRHGVVAVGPDVNAGRAEAILFRDGRSTGGLALRLGLAEVRTIGLDLAESIDAERGRGGPFRDLADLAGRVRLTSAQAEALATAGAFGCFGIDRRAALWAAGVVASVRAEHLPGTAVGLEAPALPGAHRRGAHGRGRLGHRRLPGQPPHPAPAGPARRPRRDPHRPARRPRAAQRPGGAAAARAGRRAGHPPAAPGHRGRGHVREPGRRERHAQRHVLGGAVGALPHGGAGQRGPARAGTAGAQPRGGAQPGGRPAAEAGPGRPREVAGLQVNARMAR